MKNNQEGMLNPRRNGERVISLIQNGKKITIVSPFITRSGLAPLLKNISGDAHIILYTRWRADEVAAGVSDPEILKDLRAFDTVYLHPTLHAKAYISEGIGALVGSSNTTVFGLGWNNKGGVELLVESEDNDPAIRGLLATLENTSCEANSEIADLVLKQAGELGDIKAFRENESHGQMLNWLPAYSQPKALWYVYCGERDGKVTELAQPDLISLNVPPELTEKQFNIYIANLLIQGFPGLVAERVRNLTNYQAVNELKRLASTAGITLENPEKAWHTLAAWLGYFVPDDYRVGSGGRKLY